MKLSPLAANPPIQLNVNLLMVWAMPSFNGLVLLFGLLVNGLRYLSVWFGLVYLIYRIGSVRMSFKWVVHVHTHHSNFQLLDEDPTIVLHLQPLDRSSQQASSPLYRAKQGRSPCVRAASIGPSGVTPAGDESCGAGHASAASESMGCCCMSQR